MNGFKRGQFVVLKKELLISSTVTSLMHKGLIKYSLDKPYKVLDGEEGIVYIRNDAGQICSFSDEWFTALTDEAEGLKKILFD